MLDNFFSLNKPFEDKDETAFEELIQSSKHIHSVLYRPDKLIISGKRVENIKFENVSFSKTMIEDLTFRNCTFESCLFIGSTIKNVEFHECEFTDCNFHKVNLENIYAKPHQFKKAISDKNYANIAVHLYHELRQNYNTTYQREFKFYIEYHFNYWKTINDFNLAKYHKKKWKEYYPSFIGRKIYEIFLGYGYKTRNFLITTFLTVIIIIGINHYFSNSLFSESIEPSLLESVYFTITTMATLGSSGYTPNTDVGFLFVIFNVIIGISILTTSINTIFKRLIK